jgi:predicted TPR repeat methyltransferase
MILQSASFLIFVFLRFVVDASQLDDILIQGNGALMEGNNQQAVLLYRKGIEEIKRQKEVSLLTTISLYTNLATALSSEGDNEAAALSYQQALSAYEEQIDFVSDMETKEEAKEIASQSSFFLGMVYQDLSRPKEAIEAYALTHNRFDPNHWASYANKGSVFHDNFSNHEKALEAYNQAYTLLVGGHATEPPAEPRYILSQLQYRIGLCLSAREDRRCALQNEDGTTEAVDCQEQAAHAFSLALQYDPTNVSAQHMLASLTADATMKRASNTYVQSLFDDYAVNFEHSLVKDLGYTGYERLRNGFDRAMVNIGETKPLSLVIDAGCGTGLVGEQFRNISKVLVGVDLSAAILEQAQQKRPGLYNNTRVGDVIATFDEFANQISLIIAGDSYIYFGDLLPLFEAMEKGLKPGGYAAFTLENVPAENEVVLAGTKPDWRWQLTPSGRFAHRKDYVVSISQETNLKIIYYEQMDGFRFEKGIGVRGHIFVIQKPYERTGDEL